MRQMKRASSEQFKIIAKITYICHSGSHWQVMFIMNLVSFGHSKLRGESLSKRRGGGDFLAIFWFLIYFPKEAIGEFFQFLLLRLINWEHTSKFIDNFVITLVFIFLCYTCGYNRPNAHIVWCSTISGCFCVFHIFKTFLTIHIYNIGQLIPKKMYHCSSDYIEHQPFPILSYCLFFGALRFI